MSVSGSEPVFTGSEAVVVRKLGSITLVLGALSALVGLLLLFNLFAAVRTLALIAALGIVISGLGEIAGADRYRQPWMGWALGVVWILTGILAASWPGVTLWALALVTGVGFVIGGVMRVGAGLVLRPDQGWQLVTLVGAASLLGGILCLSWPGATVLVMALLLGARLLAVGLIEIAAGLAARRVASA